MWRPSTRQYHKFSQKRRQSNKIKLENVASDDVLPLKATRRNAIANLKWFWEPPGHWRPNFDGFIYTHYAAPPYSARITVIYFLPFGKVWLHSVCHVQRQATKQDGEFTKVGENSYSI